MNIILGETYTDSVTGFEGVAIARIEYLTGCVHIGLQQKVDKEGKMPQPEYFDESRLDGSIKNPGGPADPPRRSHF